MPNTTPMLNAYALALIAAVNSAAAVAQGERWFRVELLVFANESSTQPEGAATAEQWDATPTLAYPLASRFLVDSDRVKKNEAEFQGESLVDEYGRQIITIIADQSLLEGMDGNRAQTPSPADEAPLTPAPAPLTPVYEGGRPAGVSPSGMPPSGSPLGGVEPAFDGSPRLPTPFVLLSSDYQEFRSKAAKMQRSGRYSLLFHETWVQPVAAEANSLPIVLDHSGDTLEWPRMQGTITFFLSRYLHVQTNLWLNTAGEYLPGNWAMPAAPLGPPSLIIEEQELVNIAAAIGDLPETAVPNASDVLEATGSGAEARSEAETIITAEMSQESVAEGMSGEDPLAPEQDSEVDELIEEEPLVYPYRHAVLLEQTRRMRSNEVHYMDHPLLGVIVKFTPVTAKELGVIAAAQAPSVDSDQTP
jgi:hypothetical protein